MSGIFVFTVSPTALNSTLKSLPRVPILKGSIKKNLRHGGQRVEGEIPKSLNCKKRKVKKIRFAERFCGMSKWKAIC